VISLQSNDQSNHVEANFIDLIGENILSNRITNHTLDDCKSFSNQKKGYDW